MTTRCFKVRVALIGVLLAAAICASVPTFAAEAGSPVAVTDDGPTYTLANGVITARIDKHSSDLVSLRYKNVEMVGGESGHPHGYWSHTPGREAAVTDAVTIDPGTNGGERAEVSVKTLANGKPVVGSVVDVEIRYALSRGDSALYTYSILEHRPEYPATQIGEARFAAKLLMKLTISSGDVMSGIACDYLRLELAP